MTPGRNTPMRSFRVPDETWDAAKALAEREGVTVSDVVRRGLDLVLAVQRFTGAAAP